MTEYLDNRAPTSLYYQLKEILLAKIVRKEWKVNEKIPNEIELCKMFNVSRITVRQALAELENEGYLIRRQGRGTFVTIPKIEQNLSNFYSFSEEFRKQGFNPGSKILEFHLMVPNEEITEKLRITAENPQVFYIKRLRYADEILIAIESTYIPAAVFPGLKEKDLQDKPLYDVMREQFGINPSSADETIGAAPIGEMEALYFGIKKGTAALDLERFTYSGRQCIEFTKGMVRGDVFRFHVKLS